MKYAILFCLFLSACAHADPLVEQISDSVGLGSEPAVRADLSGSFRVAHACGSGQYGVCNNGSTITILANMAHYFDRGDVDVVTFNSGIHDMTFDNGCSSLPRVPESQYFENVSKILSYLSQHAKVVIWIDTTTIISTTTCATNSTVDSYNHFADEAARQHGAYRLHIDSRYHAKDGIHFTYLGYKLIGDQIANCIVIAWANEETDNCILH